MKVKNILFGLMVLFSIHLVFAEAPTMPTTVTPLNNSIFFTQSIYDNPTLTCEGSTDPDGDNINITFYGLGSIVALNSDPLSWGYEYSGAGNRYYIPPHCTSTVGANRCAVKTNGGNGNARLSRSYYIYIDEWLVNTELATSHPQYPSTSELRIDGVAVWDCNGAACPQEWVTINTSSYNDGDLHNISFHITSTTLGSGSTAQFWFFFEDMNNDAILQNSTNTSFDWTSAPSGLVSSWNCKACNDEDPSLCSNKTDPLYFTFIDFTACTSGDVALNFTIKDEINHSDLLLSESDCALTLSSVNDNATYNFTFANSYNFSFCLTPTDIDVSLSGFVTYLPTSNDYNFTRQYNFANDLINGNNTQDITLYSLKDADTSLVLLRVRDKFGTLLQGAKVTVQRFIDGVWLTISELLTDPLGRTQGQYKLNTAYYNHIIEYNGQVVLGSLNNDDDKIQIYTEDVTNGITFNVNLEGEGLIRSFQRTFTVNSNLSYHNVTNTTGFFKYQFFDTTGRQWLTCLQVDKGLNPTEICGCAEYNVTSNTGTITCDTNQTDGRAIYYANAFLYHDETNTWFNNNQLSLSLGLDERIDWGGTGYIIALFLILVITFVFLKSPTISILLGTFMFVLLAGTGVIFKSGQNSLSWSVLIIIMVIGYLVARLKSEGGANG